MSQPRHREPPPSGSPRAQTSALTPTPTWSACSTRGKMPSGRTSSIAAETAARSPSGPSQIAAGVGATPSGEGLRTAAEAEQVGQIALAAGIALTELRAADGAGLEEMFLQLTAATQRDTVTTTEGAAA